MGQSRWRKTSRPLLASDPESADDALAAAVRLLARREHARAELSQKLRQRGFETQAIVDALDRAVELNYQSEQRFAEQFVRARVDRSQGPVKIRAELERRLVDGVLISDALSAADVDWDDLAAAARAKRFGPELPDGSKDRQKQQRFLASRGFSSDQVRRALGRW